jgi:hypothetical protein
MEWAPVVALVVVMALIVVWPFWYRAEIRRKRAKDPTYRPPYLMGIMDEIYRPDSHAASQIHEIERELPAPPPLPGDKPARSAKQLP